MAKKRVVIIGAGPAGLTAAFELLSEPDAYDVTILEESDTVGGISRTVRYKDNRMDIGGHRFFSKDDRVMNWWLDRMPLQGAPSFDDKKLGREHELTPGGPDPEKEDRVMLKRHRVSRIYYKKKFFDYPVSMSAKTIHNMGFATTMAAGFSYLGSCVHKRKEDSLEDFYINRFGRKLYSMFFEGYTEKLWGRHPREIAADWGSQRVKGLSIRAVLADVFRRMLPAKKDAKVETSLIEEFYYPKFGPGELWEETADEIRARGGRLIFGAQVVGLPLAVRDQGYEATAVQYRKDGKLLLIPADQVISSMPLKDLVDGMGSIVPDEMKKIADGLPYRDFVTIGLLIRHLNLVNETKIRTLNNIVPDCWIYVQDVGVKLGRIQIFNNWSPYMVGDPEHKVWIGLEYFCREGDEFWNMDDAAAETFAVKELVKMGVIDSPDQVLDSHREKVRKAYPAYFDTYARIGELTAWLQKIGNLYCVGRNGQHRYNNMDHSMLTAMEAVNNIRTGRKDQENIWNVNTEKEYHESR